MGGAGSLASTRWYAMTVVPDPAQTIPYNTQPGATPLAISAYRRLRELDIHPR